MYKKAAQSLGLCVMVFISVTIIVFFVCICKKKMRQKREEMLNDDLISPNEVLARASFNSQSNITTQAREYLVSVDEAIPLDTEGTVAEYEKVQDKELGISE